MEKEQESSDVASETSVGDETLVDASEGASESKEDSEGASEGASRTSSGIGDSASIVENVPTDRNGPTSGDDEDGEKSPSTTKIKINELLCFMQNMIGTIYAPTLTELCSKKYNVEEIKAARDLLYKDMNTDNKKPVTERRIKTKNTDTPSQKFASEIFQLLQENGPCKHMPRYAALDISKLPVIRYDSTDISGLLISHNKLEKTVVVLTERIKHCTKIIKDLAKNQTILSESFKEMRDCNTDNHTNNTQNMQPLPSTKMDNNTVRENMDEQIECSECDTKSQNEIDKDAHMSTHREELECSECDYTSYNDSDMKEHISSHEKEFTCSECGKEFNTKQNLKRHTESMSIVICGMCTAKFCNNHDLKGHVYSEHKCKKCYVCGKKYEFIYLHMKNIHGISSK